MTNKNTSKITNINESVALYHARVALDTAAEGLTKIETATELSGRREQGGVMLGAVIGRREVELKNRDGTRRQAEVAAVAYANKNKVDGGYSTTVRILETDQRSQAHENGVKGEVALFSFYPQGENMRGGVIDRGHEHAITNPEAALAQILGTEVATGSTPNAAELTAIAEGVQNSEMAAIQQTDGVEMLPLSDIIPELHRVA
jgi:hypothetical protein